MTNKPMHAADALDRSKIATAIKFTSFLRLSPTQKFTQEHPTLAAAARRAAELRADNPGRDALCYAIMATGESIPVPRDMQDAALKIINALPAAKGNPAALKGKTWDKKASAQKAAHRAGLKPTDFDLGTNEAGEFFITLRADQPKPLDELGDLSTQGTGLDEPRTPAGLGQPLDQLGDLSTQGTGLDPDFTPPAFLMKGHEDTMAAIAEQAPAPEPKATKAAKEQPMRQPGQKRITPRHQAQIDAALRGEMPEAPNFEAETHAPYRKRLGIVKALAEAGDIAGLQALTINPNNSSTIPLDRYRGLCVMALQARADYDKADQKHAAQLMSA